MKPVIALVGRPNVGKSTLFNALTHSRDALVSDEPGVTRDRLYGEHRNADRAMLIVDTGGLGHDDELLQPMIDRQVDSVLEEASFILFLVDARDGLTPLDRVIADRLRHRAQRSRVVVNKSEGLDPAIAVAEFQDLGFGQPLAVSAVRGTGMARLMAAVTDALPPAEAEEESTDRIRVAIIGRPNVGKSTLVNTLLGEQRVIVEDRPGTTRDSVQADMDRGRRHYRLIDTAGVRRRPRVQERLEKFSVVKTLQAIEACHVAVLVLDAREGLVDQDAAIIGLVDAAGRSLVVAMNKWDGLDRGARTRLQRHLARRFAFLPRHERIAISAAHGSGMGELLEAVDRAFDSAMIALSTSDLNRRLRAALEAVPPPLHRGRPIKMKFAHQAGRNPPGIVIHGNLVRAVPPAYRRYLAKTFERSYDLYGTRVQILFRDSVNPYGRRDAGSGARRSAGKRKPVRRPT